MSRTLPVLVFLSLLISSIVSIPATPKNSSSVPQSQTDFDSSRQLLGSSVVTSVSVVMNPKNLTKISSPIKLFNPQKYEFYALNNNGEVIKKTMTLNEIRRIVAAGSALSDDDNNDNVSYEKYEEEKINEVMEKLKSILDQEIQAYERHKLETTLAPSTAETFLRTTKDKTIFESSTNSEPIEDTITTTKISDDSTSTFVIPKEKEAVTYQNEVRTTYSYYVPVSLIQPSSTTTIPTTGKLENKEQLAVEITTEKNEETTISYTTEIPIESEVTESQSSEITTIQSDTMITETTTIPSINNSLPVILTTEEFQSDSTTLASTNDFVLDNIVSQVIEQINKDSETTVINNNIASTTQLSVNDFTESDPIVTTTDVTTMNQDNDDSLKIESSSSIPTSSSETMWQLISSTDSLQKKRIEALSPSESDLGLESTLEKMDNNKKDFIKLCNDLAFRYWHSIMSTMRNNNLARSVVMSPFAITSILSMIFLAARGQTTAEMNSILKLDGAFTFNPHYLFKTVTDSIQINNREGVLNSALVRELFSDKSHGELLNFYKGRVKFFYDGYVDEVNFTTISDIIRRRTNLFIKTKINGPSLEYLHSNTITLRPPLAAFTATNFQTDCSNASIKGRDGEMYFIVLPSVHQRRLIQIPAVVHKSNFLLGYEPLLDTIVASIQEDENSNISTVFMMPGRQSLLNSKLGPIDDLLNLEKQLIEDPSVYNLMLRTLAKRDPMEIQLPRFSHRSIINSTEILWKMGFNELLTKNRANLQGLGATNEQLYLSDLMQINTFTNCANHFKDIHHDEDTISSLSASDRQRKDSQKITRLRFNRPFLYFVRHNPTGLIIHMGRFNPRLVI